MEDILNHNEEKISSNLKKKISDIENKGNEPKNEITTQTEVSEAQEEKSIMSKVKGVFK